MVNYTCPRCGFNTKNKSKYISHLRRKFICKNKVTDDNLQNEYFKYNIVDKISKINNGSKMTQNDSKKKSFGSEMTQIDSKIILIDSEITQNDSQKKYECKYCNKLFSKSSNLTRHLKTCKEKKQNEEEKGNLLSLIELLNQQLEEQRECMKEQLERRDKQIEEQNLQIKELIKKSGINIGTQNIQQNIQQNIKILAYNNTDLSHLTDKDYLKCLKHSNFCIPHLIKEIHFNPKKPENHNIYISNLKNNYVMIYNGSKWMLNDRDESIQSLIDDKESIIEQKLEEWIENGYNYPDIMKKFNRYLEKKENNTVIDKIKGEIKLMLFNNRDIINK